MALSIVEIFVRIIFILLVLIFVSRRWKMRKNLSNILQSSYKAYPLIGHAYLALGSHEDRMNAIKKFSYEAIKTKHGSIGAWIGMKFYIVIADAQVAEVVMKSALDKSDLKGLRHLTGDGSIFAPVNIWYPRRKVILAGFSDQRLKMFVKVFATHGCQTVNTMEEVANNGNFSIWKYLVSYSMATVCETGFGIDLDMVEFTSFVKAFHDYFSDVSVRITQPWLRFDMMLKVLPLYERLEKNKRIVVNFIDKIIQQKRGQSNEPSYFQSNFLEILKESSSRKNRPFNEVELREELIVLILAATDTTAIATFFTCLMLAVHPDCQDKIFRELQEQLRDVDVPTAAHLSRLKYMDAVLKETMRLYPPVPIISRKVNKDIKLPCGLTIVEGCEILLSNWGVHRNPQYWGEDAEHFKPDRFLNSSIKTHSFQAFGIGPRNCAGQRFGMMSAKMILSLILKRFRILPPENDDLSEPFKVKFEIMLKPVNDYELRLERRI